MLSRYLTRLLALTGFIPEPLTTVIQVSLTCADTAKALTLNDVPAYDVNIHCYTNDAYYGDMKKQAAIVYAEDVIYFRNVNLRHFMFKNKTPGSNAVIEAVATVPTSLLKFKLKW